MTALVVVQANRLNRRIRITAADVEYAREHNATNGGAARRRRADGQTAALRDAAAFRRRRRHRAGRQLRAGLARLRAEDERRCPQAAPGQDAFHQLRRALVQRRVDTQEPAAARRGRDGPAGHPRRGQAPQVPAAGRSAPPPLRLGEHQPAARELPRRDRDQDRLDPGRRRMPAVRGDARQADADRRRAGQRRRRRPARRSRTRPGCSTGASA